MTGMTDISRHGGEKKHRFAGEPAYRDGLGIQVKDDALIDPALLGEVAEYSTQAENLVDDSDDDGDYELGDPGPGMATKVVQAGFKLLFFPLILVHRGIMSLKHIPWLCSQILAGIKNSPLMFKRFGKVLIVIGTFTGVIWLARRFRTSGFRFQASDQIESSEVQIQAPSQKSEVRSPKPEVRSPEQEEPKSRRKIGFGQLSKIASAFKRSEPVTSPDAVSPNNEDRYDFLETSGNRWGTRKSMLFAALCLILFIGGVTIARQVMLKNDDVVQNAPDEDTDSKDGTSEPDSLVPKSGGFPQYQGGIASVPNDAFPPFPGFNDGMQNPGLFDHPRTDTEFQSELLTPPAANNDPRYTVATAVAANPLFRSQGSGGPIQVYDSEESMSDERQSVAADTQWQPGTGVTGYGNNNGFDNDNATAMMTEYDQTQVGQYAAVELAAPPAPSQSDSDNSNDWPDSLDTTPVVRPQNTWATATPVGIYASTGGNQNSITTLQSESSLSTLPASQRTPQDRSIPTTQYDNPPVLADIYRTSNSTAPDTVASSNTGLLSMAITSSTPNTVSTDLTPSVSTASSSAGSGPMALTSMNSANTNFANTKSDKEEQLTWVTPPEPSMTQPLLQPTSQSTSQFDTGFGNVQNEPQYEPPAQESVYNQNPEPVLARITPVVSSSAGSLMSIEAPEIPVAPSLGTLSNMSVSAPQLQTPVQTTPTIAQLNPMQSVNAQPINPRPVNTQPVNVQPVTANVTVAASFPDKVQDNVSSVVSDGLISPSRHIADMPMVSSDRPTSSISQVMPPIVVNATPEPAYSAQPQQVLNTPVVQPNIPQATAAQFMSNGQNNTPAPRPNNTYVVQPGDSIYKIAKQELGSVRRYREIYELNRDRLPIGQDTLTAGIELLLPTGR